MAPPRRAARKAGFGPSPRGRSFDRVLRRPSTPDRAQVQRDKADMFHLFLSPQDLRESLPGFESVRSKLAAKAAAMYESTLPLLKENVEGLPADLRTNLLFARGAAR